MQEPTIELLDPDGGYARVLPFDEIRGRVLTSNVLEKGRVIHKVETLSWSDAASDLGGFTRLGPSEFLSDLPEAETPAWEPGEVLRALEDHEASSSPDLSGGSSTMLQGAGAAEVPPEEQQGLLGILFRLVQHWGTTHPELRAGARIDAPCRCPGFQVEGGAKGKELRILVRKALRKEPGRSRITRILRRLEVRLKETDDAA